MTEQLHIEKLQSGKARIGVVFNPLSGRNRKKTSRLREELAAIPGAVFREVRELGLMQATLEELVGQDPDLLVIAGGDGMVQEVIRYLLNHNHHDDWPLLTVIPGGTTNMTASDLGISGTPEKVITRLCSHMSTSTNPTLVTRPALRIEQPGKAVNYGMFFGAGLIARGVKFSRSEIKKIGVTGALFSLIIALRCLGGFIFGGGKGDWQPARLTARWTDDTQQDGTYLFAFASTLETLIFGTRPYWGRDQGPVHISLVKQHPQFSWWGFLRILRGKSGETANRKVYFSKNCQAFDLILNDEYIIDGELYNTDGREGTLHISTTQDLTFLVP